MPLSSFQKSSPGWFWETSTRRAREWMEWKLSQWDAPAFFPDWGDESSLGWIGAFFRWIAHQWPVTLAILLALLAYLLYRLGRRFRLGPRRENSGTRSPLDPFDQHSLSHWLKEAQRQQQAQNYDLACRALYLALLHRLDQTGQVPQQPSRTDQEYTQLVGHLSPLAAYRLLLMTHERLWFGGDRANAALFQDCLQAFEQIEQAP